MPEIEVASSALLTNRLVIVFYWILAKCFGLVRSSFHLFVTVKYFGKRKQVPPIRNELIFKSATKLANEIRDGKLKSEEVIRAYIQRISEVEPFVNATVERRYADALKEAIDVDVLVASGKLTKEELAKTYPLLGVPLSVKVVLKVKGLKSTASSMIFKDAKAAEDAPAVVAMKNAGAIILVTTNTPEMCAGLDTVNKIHGRTNNPYDYNRSSGGSSGKRQLMGKGGESALICAGGSVIGLGNDLMGSIRIPCLFTGIFGHKPTKGLVSREGSFPAFDIDMTCTGPMCRYAEDLALSMSVLSCRKEIKFGESVKFTDVKIFYTLSVDFNFTAPVCEDVQEAMKKEGVLQNANHHPEPFRS